MSEKKKRLIALIVFAAVFVAVLLALLSYQGLFDYLAADTSEFSISRDGDYVICKGEKYVPADGDYRINWDRVIEDNVIREGDSLFDCMFVYGYRFYETEGHSEHDVIYVQTAETGGSVTGYFIKESD